LQEKYSAVVLAYGAVSDRDLGLAGEYTTKNVFPSRKIVNWYNGSLDDRMQPDEFDLS
jgi:adrenodoxin-NADP+ reductase